MDLDSYSWKRVKEKNQMHYVISDIHNDSEKLNKLLKAISFDKENDTLYVLGDLFDRAPYNPNPLGVYYTVQSLEDSCTVIRGNHDEWLAKYIYKYLGTSEKKRDSLAPYDYNTFLIIKDRLTEVDLWTLADWLKSKPLQMEVEVEGIKYLLAHAETSNPTIEKEDFHYLMGNVGFSFLKNGIPGYVSICGHNPTDMIRLWYGDEYRPKKMEIWKSPQRNVYMIDCGCGMFDGCRLGCLRLEDKKEFYV